MRKLFFLISIAVVSFLTVPQAIASEEPIAIERADQILVDAGEKFIADGNVHVSWAGRNLYAGRVVYEEETELIIASQGAKLVYGDQEMEGEYIILNRATREVSVDEVSGRLLPWYVSARSIEGIADEMMVLKGGRLSTCELEVPHFYLTGSTYYYYPGDWITGYNNVVWFAHTPVFYWPWIAIDLKDRLRRWELRPGYRSRDGISLEANYHYLLEEDGYPFTGTIYTDWREYVRPGYGVDFNYERNATEAYLSYFQSRRRPLVLDADDNEVRAQKRERVWQIGSRFNHRFNGESWRFKSDVSWQNYRRFERDFATQLAPRADMDRSARASLSYHGDGTLLRTEVREEQRDYEEKEGEIDNFERHHALGPRVSYRVFPRRLPADLLRGSYDLDFEVKREFPHFGEEFLWDGYLEGGLSRSQYWHPLFRQSYRFSYDLSYRERRRAGELGDNLFGRAGFRLRNVVQPTNRLALEVDYLLRQRTSKKSEAVLEADELGLKEEEREKHGRDEHALGANLSYRGQRSYFNLDGGLDLRQPEKSRVASDSRMLPVRLHANSELTDYWEWNQFLRYDPPERKFRQLNTSWDFKPSGSLNFGFGWNFNRREDAENLSHFRHDFDWSIVEDHWRVRGDVTYNLKGSEFDEMTFLLDRNLHCWDMQLMYRQLRSDDRQIWVMFTLADYPDRGVGLERHLDRDEIDLTGSIDRQ